MIRQRKLILLFVMLILGSSCAVKEGALKDPCHSDVVSEGIARYQKSELLKLARVLELSSYPNAGKQGGCRAALLGQVYFALNRMTEASDYFSKAAEHLPELKDFFMLAKANAELENHNFDEACLIAHALLTSSFSGASSSFAMRVRLMLAKIAALEKNDRHIIKTHEELRALGYSEDEAFLWNLASALSNVDEHEKANEVYKRLLVNFPASAGAQKVLEQKGLSYFQLDMKEIEKRFNKLVEKVAFNQAVKDADFLLKNSLLDDEKRAHIHSLAIKSLVLNNQFEAGLHRGKKRAHSKNRTAKDLESYAWGLAKVGRYVDAADFYGKFLMEAIDREDKAKACFFRGFSLYEASLYSMALFAWQSCELSIKESSLYESYLWYQALAFLLNDNFARAASLLEDIRKRFKKSIDGEKYAYFLSYALSKIHKKDEAVKIMNALSAQKNPSYYVLLSRQTLGLSYPGGKNVPADELSLLAKSVLDPDLKKALTLFHLGFREEAKDLVQSGTAPASDKLAMLQHMGFYHDVWQRAHVLKPEALVLKNILAVSPTIRSSFPMPHRQIINTMSAKYEINPSLLYAIIQTESGFLETATSYRGALGLMQMMPFVAEDLATRLSLGEFNSEHLKNPHVAIELGALLVATLKRQFKDPHLILAAYNAGPHQVQKWLDRFGQLPVALFVERIPFKQTRDYIKKVLPNESLYFAMTGQKLRLDL